MTPQIFVGLVDGYRKQFTFKSEKYTLDHILNTVCKNYQVEKEVFLDKSRKKEVVEPRMTAIYLCCLYTDFTLKYLGKIFKKDHTSIVYNRETCRNLMRFDKKHEKRVHYIIELLKQTA